MKLLKRAFVFVMLFALTGVGVTFAAGENNDNIQNFFLGNAPATSGDLNQVLALLVGPQGPPGPAGVAGADGFVGLNGQDGRDGIDGAPGIAGPQGPQGAQGAPGTPGASVAVVALQVGDPNCPIGGSKLVDAAGNETFICNGRPGLPGATGATGATGAPGTGGSGGGTRFGVGSLGIGACDDNVEVELKHLFAGGRFSMNQVVISGLADACNTFTLKVWLTIRATGALFGTGANTLFVGGDEIRCEKVVTNSWSGSTNARVISVNGTDSCVNTTAVAANRGTPAPTLNSISARDLADYVGFEIG